MLCHPPPSYLEVTLSLTTIPTRGAMEPAMWILAYLLLQLFNLASLTVAMRSTTCLVH